jgi:hypothetical protein
MRNSIIAAAILSFSFGCARPPQMPASELAIAEVGVQPKSGVTLVGAFDFDIISDVDGQGCYDPRSRHSKIGSVPGLEKSGSYAIAGAQSAAIYEALTKSPGADTIMVTWTKVDVQADGSACAQVHGKAVRLRKAAPPMPEAHKQGTAMPAPPPPPMPPQPAVPGVPIMPN